MVKKILFVTIILSLFTISYAFAGEMTVPNKNGDIKGFNQGGVPTITLSKDAVAVVRCYPHNTNYPLPAQGKYSRPINMCKGGGAHRLMVTGSNGKGTITINW